MIDVKAERLIRIADVPKLPWLASRHGEPVSVATVHAWVSRGVRGIRLRTLSQGGVRVTTEKWLLEFFARLSGESVVMMDVQPPAVVAVGRTGPLRTGVLAGPLA